MNSQGKLLKSITKKYVISYLRTLRSKHLSLSSKCFAWFISLRMMKLIALLLKCGPYTALNSIITGKPNTTSYLNLMASVKYPLSCFFQHIFFILLGQC